MPRFTSSPKSKAEEDLRQIADAEYKRKQAMGQLQGGQQLPPEQQANLQEEIKQAEATIQKEQKQLERHREEQKQEEAKGIDQRSPIEGAVMAVGKAVAVNSVLHAAGVPTPLSLVTGAVGKDQPANPVAMLFKVTTRQDTRNPDEGIRMNPGDHHSLFNPQRAEGVARSTREAMTAAMNAIAKSKVVQMQPQKQAGDEGRSIGGMAA
jgi:hypothetical protein